MDTMRQINNKGNEVKRALYLYGIVKTANAPNDGFTVPGFEGKSLSLTSYRDLSVVISDVDGVRAQANRANLLCHTLVLEHIMQIQQVLPIRFGVVATSEEDIVNNVLKANYWHFNELLEKLDDKKELGLKVICDQQMLLKEIVESDDKIQKIRDSLVGRSEESTYHERITLGRMVEAALTLRRTQIKNEILATMAVCSEEYRENRLLTEPMILNAAFLVSVDREPEFDKRLNELSDRYENMLTFKYTAVAPPYNFVNLVINATTQVQS